MATFEYPTEALRRLATLTKGDYATATIRLTKEAIPLGPNLTVADLEPLECDYTGYVARAISSMPDFYIDPNAGGVSSASAEFLFATSDPTTVGNDVVGVWVENTGGDLIWAANFSAPYAMQNPGDAMPFSFIVNMWGDDSILILVNGRPA